MKATTEPTSAKPTATAAAAKSSESAATTTAEEATEHFGVDIHIERVTASTVEMETTTTKSAAAATAAFA